MGWAETRQRARRKVHSNFSFPATYFAPGATVDDGVACNVRVHTELQMFGDLDREMFAKVVSETHRLVLDTSEVPDPKKRGSVQVFFDAERTQLIATFDIANILPKQDEFLRVEVKAQ